MRDSKPRRATMRNYIIILVSQKDCILYQVILIHPKKKNRFVHKNKMQFISFPRYLYLSEKFLSFVHIDTT